MKPARGEYVTRRKEDTEGEEIDRRLIREQRVCLDAIKY
jgi:hypothetical protein